MRLLTMNEYFGVRRSGYCLIAAVVKIEKPQLQE